MKCLASVLSSGTSLSFKPNPLFSFILVSLPSLTSSAYTASLSKDSNISVPSWWSALSPITPSLSNLNSPSNGITFHFFAAFSSLLANSHFQLPVFIKCHVGLSLGVRETTQPHALLFVCVKGATRDMEWPIKWIWKEIMWLVTNHGAHLLFTYWFVD